jgi:Flp pilus assembly protein TadD
MDDVTLDEIDFDWVARCTSAKRLRRAIALLLREPFPELLAAARARLATLRPGAAQPAAEPTREELEAIDCELRSWTLAAQQADAQVAAAAPVARPAQLPPVRGGGAASQTARAASSSGATLGAAARGALAQNEKCKGDDAFRSGEFDEAVASYARSLALEEDAKTLSNRAAALLKLARFQEAEADASRALALEPDNAKALSRRAVARRRLLRFAEAVQDLRRACELRPEDKAAAALLDETERDWRAHSVDAPRAAPSSASAPASAPTPAPATRFSKVAIEEVEDDEDEEDEEDGGGAREAKFDVKGDE